MSDAAVADLLEALAAQCERDERGSDLDEAIWRVAAFDRSDLWLDYTTSLDDAVTLVPKGQGYVLRSYGVGDFISIVGNAEGEGKTPALALCAAALRARAAIARQAALEMGEG